MTSFNPCDGQCTAPGEVCELTHSGKRKCLTLEDSLQACQAGSCSPVRLCKRQGRGADPECVCRSNCTSHPTHEVCGSDGITYPSHCHLHMTACTQRRHIGISSGGRCPLADYVFSAVPPNVTIVLNGSNLEWAINRIVHGPLNMRHLRKAIRTHNRLFLKSPESGQFFNALHILTKTGYIKYKQLAFKEDIQPVLRKNWAKLSLTPIKFNNDNTRNAVLLDAVETLSWLPIDSFYRIWDDMTPIQTAFPHDIELPCVIQGMEKVRWYHNDQKIGSVFNPRQILMNGSLWIRRIRPSDEGVYRCEATTPNGLITATSIVSVRVMKDVASYMSLKYANVAFANLNIKHTNARVSLLNVTVQNVSLVNITSQHVSLTKTSVHHMVINDLAIANFHLNNTSIESMRWNKVSAPDASLQLVNVSSAWMSNISFSNSSFYLVDFSNAWLQNNSFWNMTMINLTLNGIEMVNVSFWNVLAVNWTISNCNEKNTSLWNTRFINPTIRNVWVINSTRWNYTVINGSAQNVTIFNSSWIDATWWNVSLTNWTVRNWTEVNVSYWYSLFSNFTAWNFSSVNVKKQNWSVVNGSWWILTSWNETIINTNWATVLWRNLSLFNWTVTNITESNTIYWFTDYNNYTGRNLNLLNVTRNNCNFVNSSLWNMNSINETQLNCSAEGTSYCYINYTNLDARNFTLRNSSVGYETLQNSKLFPSLPLQNIRYFEVHGYAMSVIPKQLLKDDILIEDSSLCARQSVAATGPDPDPQYRTAHGSRLVSGFGSTSGNFGDDDLENDDLEVKDLDNDILENDRYESSDSLNKFPESILFEHHDEETKELPLQQINDVQQLPEYIID